MISVSARYSPFRLKLSQRDPVQLAVTLSNTSESPAMLTYQIVLSKLLSFEKTGFRATDTRRFEKFPANKQETFYYDIWPKHHTPAGEHPALITVTEHEKRFANVKKETVKSIPLTVEE